MRIHHLSEARARVVQTEVLPWGLALPVIIGLSAASWGALTVVGLVLRRLMSL